MMPSPENKISEETFFGADNPPQNHSETSTQAENASPVSAAAPDDAAEAAGLVPQDESLHEEAEHDDAPVLMPHLQDASAFVEKPSRSSLDRTLWAIMTLACAAGGGALGWTLGELYVRSRITDGLAVGGTPLRHLMPVIFALCLAIVMARVGSWLADRALLMLRRIHQISVVDRALGIAGALVGLVFGTLLSITFNIAEFGFWMLPVKFFLVMIGAAIGMAVFSGMRDEIVRVFPMLQQVAPVESKGAMPKIIDTNIIIDGRVTELCRQGFIEGTIYVPAFVLNELQYIADSPDAMRRARGRRGLETLNELREITIEQRLAGQRETDDLVAKIPVVQVLSDISPQVASIAAVDEKLVALAGEMGAAIVTNDFNLNRVAQARGVRVLNLNALALAMRPVVLPGEELVINIVREGRENGQGVGYLEDGTMVVVGEGASHVGQNCRVSISQVIQTVAGKMIFAELREQRGAGDDLFDDTNKNTRGATNHHNQPHRSGGGQRRKSRF